MVIGHKTRKTKHFTYIEDKPRPCIQYYFGQLAKLENGLYPKLFDG